MKIRYTAAVWTLSFFLCACAGHPLTISGTSPETPAENTATSSPAENEFIETAPESSTAETEAISEDYTVILGDLTLALYENRQDFTAKLTEANVSYTYSSGCYIIDKALSAYFENDICVRFRFWNETPQTGRGIHIGDSYAQMTKQYGAPAESYGHPSHVAYRYDFDKGICEFGTSHEPDPPIDHVNVYIPGHLPADYYGPE